MTPGEIWALADCALCRSAPATVQIQTEHRAGDKIAWGNPLLVCADCRQVVTGASIRAIALLADCTPDAARLLVSRVVDVDDLPPVPPEAAALLTAGFEPLWKHTGITDAVAARWPPEHRRSLVDEQDWFGKGAPLWFVRASEPPRPVAAQVATVVGEIEQGR